MNGTFVCFTLEKKTLVWFSLVLVVVVAFSIDDCFYQHEYRTNNSFALLLMQILFGYAFKAATGASVYAIGFFWL